MVLLMIMPLGIDGRLANPVDPVLTAAKPGKPG
jgi:hypothetical protein